MRVVIQRVTKAEVKVEGAIIGTCEMGLLILAGVEEADTEEDAAWLSAKIANLRIFGDAEGKMNLSVNDVNGCMLVVSQLLCMQVHKKEIVHHTYKQQGPKKLCLYLIRL